MIQQEQLYNWIKIGLQQPEDQLSEIFYYDKRDQQFFSVLMTDYFMFDENLDIDKGVTTSYTKENLETLTDRIKRIEDKDNTIIDLPRFGNSVTEEFISQQIDQFLSINSISIENTTLWEIEENGSVTFEIDNETKKPWWKFW